MNILTPTIRNVREMVDLYVAYDNEKSPGGFFKVSPTKGYKSLSEALTRKEFCRCLTVEGRIVAWLLARNTPHPFTEERALQQYFFASNLKGVLAYRAVVLLHELLEEEGRKKNYDIVVSSSSHLDENFTFTKILEKQGWTRQGYLALKRLAPASRHQAAPLRRKRGRGLATPMPS